MAGITDFGADVQSIGAFIDAIMDKERLMNGNMSILSVGLSDKMRLMCVARNDVTGECVAGLDVKIDDAEYGLVYWGQGRYMEMTESETEDWIKDEYGYRIVWKCTARPRYLMLGTTYDNVDDMRMDFMSAPEGSRAQVIHQAVYGAELGEDGDPDISYYLAKNPEVAWGFVYEQLMILEDSLTCGCKMKGSWTLGAKE